ncbi:MAG TPA: PKD domain-containing protein, partial [Mycobacteriales bacterium]|nr:PKD domain-containing protein [Mycobacteriales bacterium]
AIAIARGSHVVELATIDTQGYMAGYDEGPYGLTVIRQDVAAWLAKHGAPGAGPEDIVISSLHEHAVPTLFGIWGPMSHQVRYLAQVARALRAVCERAYARAKPATLEWGTANAPWLGGGNIAEGNEFEGWPRDGFLLALRARDLHTGATIATYTSEPAYPNIVFGPQDLVPAHGRSATQISPDFPWYANEILSRRLGGVSIVASATLSNQASPQQADSAPSPDLPPVHGQPQTRAFDDVLQMAGAVTDRVQAALAHPHVVTDPTLAGTEQHVISPVDNPALVALNYLDSDAGEGTVGTLTGGSIYPAARSTHPPYAYGAALGTWVTGLRIGKLVLLSEPGEFAAPIHDTWRQSIHGADAVAVIGAAQDFLGYEYPAYTTPFTVMGGDELIFNPGVELGDQVTLAGQQDAQALGFDTDFTRSPEASVGDNDYTQVTRPGVLILPRAVSGDVRGQRGWVAQFEAAAQVPRTQMRCSNPALLVTPPGCTLPEDAMGAFHWDFGDGTRLVTPVQAQVRASFSPFVRHVYQRPGRYTVTVWSQDSNGVQAQDRRTIVVHPAPRATLTRHGGRVVAGLRGGDGGLLTVRWQRPDGATSQLDAVPVEWAVPGTRVTVTDGTGTGARAQVSD